MADETQQEQTYTASQYNALLKERDTFKSQAEQFESKYSKLNVKLESTANEWQQKYQSLESQLSETMLNHDMEKSFLVDGIDDEDVIEFVKYKYKSVPTEQDKPKPKFGEWYNSYRESKPAILSKWIKEEAQESAQVVQSNAHQSIFQAPRVNQNVVQTGRTTKEPDFNKMSPSEIISFWEKQTGQKLKPGNS